ncbi:MAG: hypothetical protein WDA23_05010 [Gemmobacter sp.]
MRLAIAALCAVTTLPPGAASAETAISGAEFESRVTGRTLTFGLGGEPYGIERYLPGRKVIWAFIGAECQRGLWYEDAPGLICFTYEHDPTPQCWRFYDDGGGGSGALRARFQGAGGGNDLIEVENSDEPMICPGPRIGV